MAAKCGCISLGYHETLNVEFHRNMLFNCLWLKLLRFLFCPELMSRPLSMI